MVRAYIVAEMRPYREALAQALASSAGVEVVGASGHPAEAMCALASVRADVGLLDLPSERGPWWAAQIASSFPALRLIVLGLEEPEQEVAVWAAAGVRAYVGRDACLDEVGATITAIAAAPERRGTGIRLEAVRTEPRRPWEGPRHLTVREREVLGLIADGWSNEEIGRRLFIAVPTVKNHVHNILDKLGVHRRIDAVRAIRRAGLVRTNHPSMQATGRPRLRLVSRADQ
jgi:DNA-binding NarL/FixJ family response regulator